MGIMNGAEWNQVPAHFVVAEEQAHTTTTYFRNSHFYYRAYFLLLAETDFCDLKLLVYLLSTM
jgi:hypothetical protein